MKTANESRSNQVNVMKREIVAIENVFGVDALKVAEALAGSGEKAKRDSVINYRRNLNRNLLSLSNKLVTGTYVPDPGTSFNIISQGKMRHIHKVGYEARIVDQAIVNAIEPRIKKSLIKRTYGCISGRGGLMASKQLRRDMTDIRYFVKADIKKYYPMMRREILMSQLSRLFKGSAFLHVVDDVLNAYVNKDVPGMEREGVSIGSLKSQIFGNLYLSQFDHYVQEKLRVKYYYRYVDDMVFGFRTKREAVDVIKKISDYLKKELGIELHKIRLAPVGRQIIDFCMYQHRKDKQGKVYVMLRKRVMYRCYSAMRDIQKRWSGKTFKSTEAELKYIEKERSRVCSYLGYLKYCNGQQTIKLLKNGHNDIFRRIERCAKGARRGQASNACAA